MTEEPQTPRDIDYGDLTGRTLGGFRILRKLGSGGMAVVYKAEHIRISRPSAIKILNPDLTGTPELVERFGREAEMASRINHPNAAGIYDVGEEEDGLVYITMEFVDGEPLSRIIKREGPLPLDRVVNIIRQVADALDAAHQLHIVHRDMKPDNIMVCRREGKPDWVKVVDFGIAQQARHGIGYKALTQRGVILGTPEYMSPEQLLRKPLDPRSDIYSLGLVVFKSLTGKAAFEGLTPQARMIKKLSEPPMHLSDAKPDLKVSPQVEEVLRKALDPEPDACAPASAQDIALPIVHEDEALLVIDKPAGLVVHPGSGNRDGTLMNALLHHAPALARLPRAGIVHRLDKDTSGLMVVARTLQAQTSLVRQLQARSVHREYLALVAGTKLRSTAALVFQNFVRIGAVTLPDPERIPGSAHVAFVQGRDLSPPSSGGEHRL